MNFDNFFVKAKEVFETAYKKTEDVVNVGKQKLDMSTLENKLGKSYETLGKLCYDVISKGEPFDPETVKPVTDDITEKLAQIEELKKEILKAKNKKMCPYCNTPVEKNSQFCNNCGKNLNTAD
ncbi:MAG: zinc ribbon domain-containing protein [Clostridia bacterium]|nr:zinc ribbon domain-containing protein [Clostridia bacterium]